MAQLDDSNCSFYLALAESKRFRLGHIRNGKISDRLYPKRKDFVSLNVAIKNLAAMHWSYPAYENYKRFFTSTYMSKCRLFSLWSRS